MAKLKFSVDGDLPEHLKGLVTPLDDGEGFELDAERLVDLPKLDDFRTNNRQLFSDKERLGTELESTKAKVAELESQLEGGKQKVTQEKTDLETRLKDLEEKISAKDKALQEERQRADRQKVRSDIGEALAASGVKDGALADALEVATKGWQVDGDALKLYQGEDLVLSKDNAGEPISPQEFAATFLKARPHFLAESSGDGGSANGLKTVNGKIQIQKDDAVKKGIYAEELSTGKAELVD